MARAVVCPICQGQGWVGTAGETAETKSCHGCGGKGWVEVSDDTCVPVEHPEAKQEGEGSDKAGDPPLGDLLTDDS